MLSDPGTETPNKMKPLLSRVPLPHDEPQLPPTLGRMLHRPASLPAPVHRRLGLLCSKNWFCKPWTSVSGEILPCCEWHRSFCCTATVNATHITQGDGQLCLSSLAGCSPKFLGRCDCPEYLSLGSASGICSDSTICASHNREDFPLHWVWPTGRSL